MNETRQGHDFRRASRYYGSVRVVETRMRTSAVHISQHAPTLNGTPMAFGAPDFRELRSIIVASEHHRLILAPFGVAHTATKVPLVFVSLFFIF